MIFDFAYLTLVLALVLSAFGAAAGFWGGRLVPGVASQGTAASGQNGPTVRNPSAAWGHRLTASSFHSIYAVCALVGISAAVLWYGLLTDQFQITYIWNSSERTLPTFYKFAAIWGGQAGSLLFWTLLLSLFTTAAALTFRASQGTLMPYVNGTLLAIILFFLVLLVFSANPFEQIGVVPSDGRGLNPLLQNYWMVIHPVMLYLGWVGLSIPFAFAVAALLSRRLDRRWVRTVRRWTLIPWMFLSAGIIMGSQWAYMELGWGGYWAWDPVENASFLPWLTATAFLHSIIIQEQRGILKVWNVTLIWLTFTLVILGTFTTRSGILSSVHSFAQSPVGPYFLVFLAVITVGFLLLLYQRLPFLQGENEIDSISSREGAFLANNWLFAGIAFVVLWGTFYPMFSEILTGERISVAAPWFNRVAGPLFLLLFVLMGVGPLLGWRRTGANALRRQFTWPLAAALISVPFLLFTSRNIFPIVGFSVCIFVAATIVQEFVRGATARRRSRGEPLPAALWGLIRRNGRRYGGYVIHFGIVLIGVAIIGNEFYQSTTHVTLSEGDTVELSGYTLKYVGLESEQKSNHTEIRATLNVSDASSGRPLSKIFPRRNIYEKTPDQPTSEVGLRMTPAEDVYVILNGWEGDGKSATFTVYINPLTMWMWVGGLLVVLGTLVSVWPHPQPARASQELTSPMPEGATAGQATA
ncbi:MAG: heme lyase CcmF/NrfE family subunit [Caldilineaceae bacterium SB0664_bin_27]|uniref:Heme lyase CcmF/NrfE family subunit n=1 Tax=Caldilineaceae bacterium SB0664_bin_27 TaxID=2605260 RepID=A0A6B0YPG5_9CHLR|nr:heme lyase CcmF/NrfE family subunit [Caldilineaceae bacterium SB0664_bin_27]